MFGNPECPSTDSCIEGFLMLQKLLELASSVPKIGVTDDDSLVS